MSAVDNRDSFIDFAYIKSKELNPQKESFANDLISQLLASETPTFPQITKAIALLQNLNADSKKVAELVQDVITKSPFSQNSLLCLKRMSFHTFTADTVDVAFTQNITQENANAALWHGVEIGNIALVKGALEQGASPNHENSSRITALLLAAKNGWADVVNLLLQHGANAKVIRGTHHHETPLSEALRHSSCMGNCLEALKIADDGFTETVMDLKILGHIFSINLNLTVDEESFDTRGFRPRYILPKFLSVARTFYEQLKTDKKIGDNDTLTDDMIAALDSVVPLLESCQQFIVTPKETLLKRLENGFPIPLYGLVRTGESYLHAWALLATRSEEEGKYHVYRCNRGGGSSSLNTGILIGQYDHLGVKKLIEEFIELDQWQAQNCPDINPLIKIDQDLIKLGSIKQKGQKIGNCTYTSLTSLHVAILYHVLKEKIGDDYAKNLSKVIHKKFIKEMQETTLNKFLNNTSTITKKTTLDFMAKLAEKIFRNPKYLSMRKIIEPWLKEHWNAAITDGDVQRENQFHSIWCKLTSITLSTSDQLKHMMELIPHQKTSSSQNVLDKLYTKGGMEMTLMMEAVRENKIDVLGFLIENDASVSIANDHGEKAWMFGLANNSIRLTEMLLSLEEDDQIDLTNQAINNIWHGSRGVTMDWLLKRGIDVNSKDELGHTKLMSAVSDGFTSMVNTLLNQPGIDIDIQDNDGNTVLMQLDIMKKQSTPQQVGDREFTLRLMQLAIKKKEDHVNMMKNPDLT